MTTEKKIDMVTRLIEKWGITDEDMKQDMYLLVLEKDAEYNNLHRSLKRLVESSHSDEDNLVSLETLDFQEVYLAPAVHKKYTVEELLEILYQLGKVSEREQYIFNSFLFDKKYAYDLSKEMELSKERIRQLFVRSLKKSLQYRGKKSSNVYLMT